MYYVSIILDFFCPTHPLKVLNQHKHNTERQQNWQFSRPTYSVLCWRNIWMVPYESPAQETNSTFLFIIFFLPDLVVLTQSLVRLHLRQQLHLQQALAEKTVWWTWMG